MNILDNAIDALTDTGEGSAHMIRISTSVTDIDNEKFVMIVIENSGPAVPDHQIRKLFDPFFTTKEPGRGVGLGLSISYNIIREHRGNLSVFNRNGMVVFEVRLPV
jgi:C4-dicarboxylate-specific signal transduction histidine kinase